MNNYNLEKMWEKDNRYRIEGESVLVKQTEAEYLIILRVDASATEEQYKAVEKKIWENGLMGKVLVVPHYVRHLKVLPVVGEIMNRETERECECGGIMVKNTRGYICNVCGNEMIRDGVVAY